MKFSPRYAEGYWQSISRLSQLEHRGRIPSHYSKELASCQQKTKNLQHVAMANLAECVVWLHTLIFRLRQDSQATLIVFLMGRITAAGGLELGAGVVPVPVSARNVISLTMGRGFEASRRYLFGGELRPDIVKGETVPMLRYGLR